MTVTTVYADTGDGYLSTDTGAGSNYATARGGASASADTGSSSFGVGQQETAASVNRFFCYEAFVAFDLSAITDTDVPSVVVLSLDGVSNFSEADDDFEVHEQAFGTLTAADWQTGDAYNALTPLATWNTSGYSAGYNDFTSDSGFLSVLDFTGTLELIVISQNQVDNTAPAANTREYVFFASANATGTSTDPKLTITHAAAPASGHTSRLALLGVN